MNYILLAIAAAVFSAIATITDKFLLGRVPIRGILAIVGSFGILSLLLLPLTGAADPTLGQWLFGMSLGLLLAIAVYAYLQGLRHGEVSRLAPLSILSTVFITLGGVFIYGDALTTHQIVALVLFAIGSFLLAVHFERRVEIFEPETWINFANDIGENALLTVTDSSKAGRRLTIFVTNSVSELRKFLKQLSPEQLLHTRVKTKIRLVKGFWWYFTSVILLIPYTLLAKELYVYSGSVPGFVTIRLGLALGCFFMVATGAQEIRKFLSQRRLIIIASIKEIFGALSGFLALIAFTLGPLGIVRGLLGMDSILILIGGTILTSAGILHEVIDRHSLVQKGLGIIAMLAGITLLFI